MNTKPKWINYVSNVLDKMNMFVIYEWMIILQIKRRSAIRRQTRKDMHMTNKMANIQYKISY